MPKLLDRLNPQQLAAVTLPGQHALILAGAGSGKTRVLTTRIAWLVQTGQATPSGILAVTFTNKAAKEMLARLSAMLPINTRGMWIGTFHGLCNRMLRAHHRDAGLPALFQILDSADQLSAIKRLLKALNVDDEKFPPRELQHFINARKEAGLRPGAVEAWDDYTRRRVELYRAYEEQCQREGVVDFAELLLRCHELLEFNEPIRRHYQARFSHILVDEFQDTNPLQYRWLKLLAGAAAPRAAAGAGAPAGACLFAVGDDDQSIYAFRGADVGNMRDFEREFAAANVIRLEQNYRSHGNILDAANAVIRHNAARLGKNLWTEAGAGEPLRVFEAASDTEEARWIVEEIRALVGEGMSRGEIALLYRSNAQSRVLEHALFSAGIAYRVYGGLRFFERQEVKHALAYLRLICRADDDTAFMRVVNFPARGIGARSLEVLQDAARAAGTSLHGAAGGVTGKAGAVLGGFITLLARLRTACEGLTLAEMVEQVVELSGLRQHYQNEREGQERLANLDELVNAAAGFVAEEEGARSPAAPEAVSAEAGSAEAAAAPDRLTAFGSDISSSRLVSTETGQQELTSFLTHAALEAGEHQADESRPAVQLMTVHAAKGLEFGAVFISGVEEGLFPHEQAVTERDGLEEERRLMYVAITRAQRRLYLSFAQTRMLHGHLRYSLRSRFLDEIPPQLLKSLTPPMRTGAASARPFGAAGGYGSSYGGYAGNRGGNGGVRPGGGAPAGRVAQATGGGAGFRVGQTVSHPKFGQGVIVAAEGSGSDARVQVNFGREGMKWLALAVAKLTPL